jgi:outer membrane protein insertion porin family
MQRRIYRTQILQGDSLELAQAIDPVAAAKFDHLKFSGIFRGTFTTDRRNSFFAPTDGHFGNGTAEFGFNGFSGTGWGKIEADARIYRPIFNLSTYAIRGHIGGIVPWGAFNFVPLQSLFWAGGANSIRGWGPREMLVPTEEVITGDDALHRELFEDIQQEGRRFQGGLVLLELMAELRTRLFVLEGASGLAQQLNNFSLIIFMDAGNAYYRDYSEWKGFGDFFANTGLATGVSLGYDTPIGPFRFGFGVPIYDPINYLPGERVIFSGHALKISDFAWHVSIGHAF